MACRWSPSQHDDALRHFVFTLLQEGYDVKARIEGWFEAPEVIYGYRPDIVARKGGHVLIIEIKKAETDWPKISALKRFEHEHDGYELRVVTPDEVKGGACNRPNAY